MTMTLCKRLTESISKDPDLFSFKTRSAYRLNVTVRITTSFADAKEDDDDEHEDHPDSMLKNHLTELAARNCRMQASALAESEQTDSSIGSL